MIFSGMRPKTGSELPEYVFLAGDGSLDHVRGFGADGEDLVPALMTVTADGLVPSDNLLADWQGGDGVPEAAIGRLPAHSAGDPLAIYREKVIEFSRPVSGEWKHRALWLADAADVGGEFPDDLQALVDQACPTATTNERIMVDRLGAAGARQQTLESWNNGAVMIQFLGHGALDFIANSGLVATPEDVAGMTNEERTATAGRADLHGRSVRYPRATISSPKPCCSRLWRRFDRRVVTGGVLDEPRRQSTWTSPYDGHSQWSSTRPSAPRFVPPWSPMPPMKTSIRPWSESSPFSGDPAVRMGW